ncbi:MAG TPA: flavin reductase family protein [Longimicrobiales bacterium]|nr:flavin reductase family protein [Longimicrobiales bacterium]
MTLESEPFREAMAHWASGVAIAACRRDTGVVATTITAFMSLSAEPPLVLLALGPNATIRPFLEHGADFAISVLGGDQRRLAMVYADTFAVGASPFAASGPPVIPDALTTLTCRVADVRVAGSHLVVTAAVLEAVVRHGTTPLIRYLRRYHELDG